MEFDHAALVPRPDSLLVAGAAAHKYFHVHDAVLLGPRLGVVVTALDEDKVARAQIFLGYLKNIERKAACLKLSPVRSLG